MLPLTSHLIDSSDRSEETIDNQENDPGYDPEGGAMNDTEETNAVELELSLAAEVELSLAAEVELSLAAELEPSPADVQSVSVSNQNIQLSGTAVANCEANPELESKPGSSNYNPVACSQRGSEDDSQIHNQEDDPDYDTEETNAVELELSLAAEVELSLAAEVELSLAAELEPSPADVQSVSVNNQNNQLSGAAVANCEANPELESKPGSSDCNPVACSQEVSEDDSQWCNICFEPWTSSGVHRLVSLKCGHLFGRSCIRKWLKKFNACCPQCKSRAKRSEIRNIYARAIKVLDPSEWDKAYRMLAKEKKLRRTAERTAVKARIRHRMATKEIERLKGKLMEAKLHQDFRAQERRKKIMAARRCKRLKKQLMEAQSQLMEAQSLLQDFRSRVI